MSIASSIRDRYETQTQDRVQAHLKKCPHLLKLLEDPISKVFNGRYSSFYIVNNSNAFWFRTDQYYIREENYTSLECTLNPIGKLNITIKAGMYKNRNRDYELSMEGESLADYEGGYLNGRVKKLLYSPADQRYVLRLIERIKVALN